MIMQSEAKEIANQTAVYLGGYRRLSAIIGAKDFSFDTDGAMTFKFKACKKANCVKFLLVNDLYTVQFFKINVRNFVDPCPMVHEIERVYADQLGDVFEDYTGLYLSLGLMGRGARNESHEKTGSA